MSMMMSMMMMMMMIIYDVVNDDAFQDILYIFLEYFSRLTNLTHKHYAERLYIHLRRNSMKKEWLNLMSKPVGEQHLEDGKY